MIGFTKEEESDAANALDAICGPLSVALERVALIVGGMTPGAATAAGKMLHRAEGSEWDHRAFDSIQTELDRHIAKHLAKTADRLCVDVGRHGHSWTVLVTCDLAVIQNETFPTYEEAKAAGDALYAFLSLRGTCDYQYEVPKPAEVQDADVPF